MNPRMEFRSWTAALPAVFCFPDGRGILDARPLVLYNNASAGPNNRLTIDLARG